MATPEEQKAADKKAADEKDAANKKLADEQAAAAKAKTDALNAEKVIVSGDAKLGGPFTVEGPGLENSRGQLTIAGQPVKITSWTDLRVKGEVPAGLKGDVVLTTASGQVRKGEWPYVRPVVVKTTTTTTETVPAK